MKLSDNDLKNLWRKETQRGAHRTDCLSTELLARAGAGDLSAPEREQMATHLAACADCAEEYRIALSVRDWSRQAVMDQTKTFPATPVTDALSVSGWRRFVPEIFSSGRLNPLTAALAAALLLSLGLGAWLISVRQQNRALVAQLDRQQQQQNNEASENATLKARIEELQRQQAQLGAQFAQQQSAGQEELRAEIEKLKNELTELARPQIDVPQFDIDPAPATRSAGSNAKGATINVPATATSFTLNLPGAGSKPFPQYLLELIDAKTNKTVWSAQRKQDGETTFTLTLIKRTLPAGKYRVRVFGVNEKRKERISDYEIEVSYSAQPETLKSR